MLVKESFTCSDNKNFIMTITYEEPSVCPLCGASIKPETLNRTYVRIGEAEIIFIATYLCRACFSSFVSQYHVYHKGSENPKDVKLIYTGPIRYKERTFDEGIQTISPEFITIYNQALAAESLTLDRIAGIGYRKSLEFLIKDYLIHKFPQEIETIKSMALANCIANKVPIEKIKVVASRCAWLGNDEAHYVRKHNNTDLVDLKRLIEASVYWVSMELVTEDALSMG